MCNDCRSFKVLVELRFGSFTQKRENEYIERRKKPILSQSQSQSQPIDLNASKNR